MKWKFGKFTMAKNVLKAIFGKIEMDYDIDELGAFVEDKSTEVMHDLLNDSNLKTRMNVMQNVKGSELIKIINSKPTLQSAAACGWTPEGGMILTDKTIKTYPLKIQEVYCNENLNETWAQMMNAIGANVQNTVPPTFADALIVYYQKQANILDENLIINGDTASLDVDLLHYDGFIKQWNNDVLVKVYDSLETAITDANAFAIAKGLVASIPTKVKRHRDAVTLEVLVGYETAQKIINNIHNTKDYNAFIPTTEEDGSITFILPTTNITFRSIQQLDETDVMVAAPHKYMFYATDLSSDIDGFTWKYSDYEDELRFGVKWRSGIAYIFSDTFTRLVLAV